MKKMNNYEAPKAEVLELNADKAFMTIVGPTLTDTSEGSF